MIRFILKTRPVMESSKFRWNSFRLYLPNLLSIYVKATGTMNEDAGDGFQYRKGQYLISHFTTTQKGSLVTVTITPKDVYLKPINRNYKVCIVTSKGTVTGKWTKSTTLKVPLTRPKKK